MKNYEKHRLNILPNMDKDDYNLLYKDIEKNGYNKRYPIILYEGKILDGWHRYKVCKEINIEPTYETFEGTKFEAFELVQQSNRRRHLTPSQKAFLAHKSKEVYEEIQKETEKERRDKISKSRKGVNQFEGNRLIKKGNDRLVKNFTSLPKQSDTQPTKSEISQKEEQPENIAEQETETIGNIVQNKESDKQTEKDKESDKKENKKSKEKKKDYNENKSITKFAKAHGANPTYVSYLNTLEKDHPEYYKEYETDILNGKKTISEVKKEIYKKEVEKRLSQTKKEGVDISDNINDIIKEGKKYKIIYADPPWAYADDLQANPKLGGVSKHYNQMSQEELCSIPIQKICENNCVLFLWTTAPKIPEAIELIKAWGFDYKTNAFIWDKIDHNMGWYSSVRHELLLVGGKGKSTPENKKLFNSVQSIQKSKKHSEKPEEFRTIIDTLYPTREDGEKNRIELFSRKIVEGWDCVGNEAIKKIRDK